METASVGMDKASPFSPDFDVHGWVRAGPFRVEEDSFRSLFCDFVGEEGLGPSFQALGSVVGSVGLKAGGGVGLDLLGAAV